MHSIPYISEHSAGVLPSVSEGKAAGGAGSSTSEKTQEKAAAILAMPADKDKGSDAPDFFGLMYRFLGPVPSSGLQSDVAIVHSSRPNADAIIFATDRLLNVGKKTPDYDYEAKRQLLKAVADLPEKGLDPIVSRVIPLISKDTLLKEKTNLLKIIGELSETGLYTGVMSAAEPLLAEGPFSNEIAAILTILKELEPAWRHVIVSTAIRLINVRDRPYMPGDRFEIFRIVAGVPADRLDLFVETSMTLILKYVVLPSSKICVCKYIAGLSAEQVTVVMPIIELLMAGSTDTEDVDVVFTCIGEFTPDQLCAAMSLAAPLMATLSEGKFDVFVAIAELVAAGQYEAVISKVSPFITGVTNGVDIARLLNLIGKLTPDQRDVVISAAAPLIVTITENKTAIFQAVQYLLAADQYDAVIAAVTPSLKGLVDGKMVYKILIKAIK